MMINNEKLLNEIDIYIKKHETEITEDLKTLVNIPSVRSKEVDGMPFGKSCYDILEASLKLMEREGFKGQISKGGEYVCATNRNDGKTIGIFAHGDVVSADGEWLYGEPFELTEKDGFLIGRGCNDDKSGIIQMLYAAKIIKELNIPLKSRLMLFVGGNEEDGMDDIKAYVKNEPMPDVSIVPDGEYPYYRGEKSIVRLMLKSKDSFNNIKSISGGSSYNIIPDNLEVVYNDGEIKNIKGISGHSANPEGTLNPLIKFSQNAQADDKLSYEDKKILKNICEIFKDNYGTGFGIAHNDDLFGRLTCTNGVIKTEDNRLLISLDIRHSPYVSCKDIINKIKTVVKDDWEIICTYSSEGYLINEDNPFADAVSDAYKIALGNPEDVHGKIIGGGTYTRYLNNSYSIGTVMYDIGGRPDMPKGHGGVHQPDEAMSLKGFLEAIKTLILVILKFDEIL